MFCGIAYRFCLWKIGLLRREDFPAVVLRIFVRYGYVRQVWYWKAALAGDRRGVAPQNSDPNGAAFSGAIDPHACEHLFYSPLLAH